MDDDFPIVRLAAQGSPEDLIQAMQHVLRIIRSIDDPCFERVMRLLALVNINVIINLTWPDQRTRDAAPRWLAMELESGLEQLDAYDESIGSRA